jgi:beta-mannosidase
LKPFNNINLEVKAVRFDGTVLKEFKALSKEKIQESILKFDPVQVSALVSDSDKDKAFLQLTIKDKDGIIIAVNQHFFTKPKDLQLTHPSIKIRKTAPDEIEISTDVLAKDIYLMGDTHFSDNFFDLLPGSSKKIKLSKPLENIEVMSLWDTLQN